MLLQRLVLVHQIQRTLKGRDYSIVLIPGGEPWRAILEAVYYNKIFSENMVCNNTTQNYGQCLMRHSLAWQSKKGN